jgi:AraC family transcriptional regulator
MSGYDHVVRAIEDFERSLDGESPDAPIRSVAEFARRAGYSVHHFTRLFAAVVGTPPKEYLLGRTLTEAARIAAETDAPLRSVAERLGFADYETFSRAFRRRFGFPPSRLREPGASPPEGTPRATPTHPRPSAGPSVVPEPTRVRVDGFSVTGMTFYVDERASDFRGIWETFMRVQDRVRGRVVPDSFYQVSSWPETDDLSGLAVLCGLRTEGAVEQEPLFVTRTLPTTDCLRFVHPGGVETIRDTYDFIYRDYLPGHDTRPASSWEYQRYADDGRIEVYLPVGVRT